VERQLPTVIKKGGDREPFDRDKIKRGLAKACWKRPVAEDDIEAMVCSLEAELFGSFENEVPSDTLGERAMDLLRTRDQVAYVRFASVYREFKDVRDFMEELEPILEQVSGLEQVRGVEAAELVGSELSSKQRPRSVPPKG
jgi:transcriptional repressor NrdR